MGYSRAVKRGPFIFVSGGCDAHCFLLSSHCWLGGEQSAGGGVAVHLSAWLVLMLLSSLYSFFHALILLSLLVKPGAHRSVLRHNPRGCLAGTSAVDQATGRVMHRRDAYKQAGLVGMGAGGGVCAHVCYAVVCMWFHSSFTTISTTHPASPRTHLPPLHPPPSSSLQTQLPFSVIEQALRKIPTHPPFTPPPNRTTPTPFTPPPHPLPADTAGLHHHRAGAGAGGGNPGRRGE